MIAALLVLAMTVVVAGIVAVVATGMTGDLQNRKQVGLIVKFAASDGDVLVTVVSGKDVPELKKLEVIDAGAADAKFREVRFSDGGAVASFTAGAMYVAKNIATPETVKKTYTTPIAVKGTFKDNTEVVLLNTKLSFLDVKSLLSKYLSNLTIQDYFGKKEFSLDIAQLFLSGKPITIDGDNIFYRFHNQEGTITNAHGINIYIPPSYLPENTYAKITTYKVDSNGNKLGTAESTSIMTNPSRSQFTLDDPLMKGLIVTIEVYDKTSYDAYKEYKTNLDTYNKLSEDQKKNAVKPTPPPEPESIASQMGTIIINKENLPLENNGKIDWAELSPI